MSKMVQCKYPGNGCSVPSPRSDMIIKNAAAYRRRRLALTCAVTAALLGLLTLHWASLWPGTVWPASALVATIVMGLMAHHFFTKRH